jgi:hypothetical protein
LGKLRYIWIFKRVNIIVLVIIYEIIVMFPIDNVII